MPSQTELRKQITERIIAALEGNILPWRKSWVSARNTGRPSNVATKRPILVSIRFFLNFMPVSKVFGAGGGARTCSGSRPVAR